MPAVFDYDDRSAQQVIARAAQNAGQSQQSQVEVRRQTLAHLLAQSSDEAIPIAKGLGVDPYTTNPILSKKLSDMAWVAFSGRFGIQAAMSVLVPYSMAMSAVTITNTTVYDTPQGDLINKDQAIFAETGARPRCRRS